MAAAAAVIASGSKRSLQICMVKIQAVFQGVAFVVKKWLVMRLYRQIACPFLGLDTCLCLMHSLCPMSGKGLTSLPSQSTASDSNCPADAQQTLCEYKDRHGKPMFRSFILVLLDLPLVSDAVIKSFVSLICFCDTDELLQRNSD